MNNERRVFNFQFATVADISLWHVSVPTQCPVLICYSVPPSLWSTAVIRQDCFSLSIS